MGVQGSAQQRLVPARVLVMTPAYAELHCVSNFSFLRGASHPGELVIQAQALGYSALALTDECSMAGMVRAHEAAKKCGMKLIVGAEFHTVDDLHIVLLATSQRAYAQICKLITTGRMGEGIDKGSYRLMRANFEEGLSECLALWIPSSAGAQRSQAAWMRNVFPDRAWIAVVMLTPAPRRHLLSSSHYMLLPVPLLQRQILRTLSMPLNQHVNLDDSNLSNEAMPRVANV